jgi:hypothetical protein
VCGSTSATVADTDGDDTKDGAEVGNQTDPTDSDWGGSGGKPAPETFQAAFEVAASGKQIKQDCAVCHWPEVWVGNTKLKSDEAITLRTH